MNTTINIGDRFGHLTIINKDTRPLHRASWLCRCDCGRELFAVLYQSKASPDVEI